MAQKSPLYSSAKRLPRLSTNQRAPCNLSPNQKALQPIRGRHFAVTNVLDWLFGYFCVKTPISSPSTLNVKRLQFADSGNSGCGSDSGFFVLGPPQQRLCISKNVFTFSVDGELNRIAYDPNTDKWSHGCCTWWPRGEKGLHRHRSISQTFSHLCNITSHHCYKRPIDQRWRSRLTRSRTHFAHAND